MKTYGFDFFLLFSTALMSLSKSEHIKELLEIKPWKKFNYAPTLSATGISEKCVDDTRRYVESLDHGENWAKRMYDATGKLSEDFYNFTSVGTLPKTTRHETGLYEECISIIIDEFEGQYCTIFFEVEPVKDSELIEDSKNNNPRIKASKLKNSLSQFTPFFYTMSSITGMIDFCLPSSCTSQDLNTAVSQIVGMNTIGPGNNYTVVTIGNENFCHTREKAPLSFRIKEPAIIVFVAVVSLLILLVFLATVFESFNEGHMTNHPIILSFSVINNGRHLFSTRRSSHDTISCVNGIRVISECMIVMLHSGLEMFNYRSYNNKELVNLRQSYTTVFGDTTLLVDTFFVISGLLVSSAVLSSLDRLKGKMNILFLYFLRILRFAPVYAAVLYFETFIVEHLGSGPDWYSIKQNSQSCRKYWWTHLLYCMRYTWHIASDMQLFWFSPLFIYPLWRSKKNGLILIGVLISLAVILDATVQSVYNLPPSLDYIRSDESSTSEYEPHNAFFRHTQTYNKVPSYLSGILLGWIIHRFGKAPSIHIPKTLLFIGWISAISAAFWLKFSISYYTDEGQLMMLPSNYPFLAVILGSLRGPVYSFALCWIIFVCHIGYAGWLNRFLSWDLFLPMSRMSFSIFLIHDTFIRTAYSVSRKPIYFTGFTHAIVASGILLFSIFASIIISLLIEMPFKNLQSLLFKSYTPSKEKIPKKDN